MNHLQKKGGGLVLQPKKYLAKTEQNSYLTRDTKFKKFHVVM